MMMDLTKIPMSRFGSYFAISQSKSSGDFILRDLHGGDECPDKLFTLEMLVENGRQHAAAQTEPTCLTLSSGEGKVEICFGTPDTVNICGNNAGLRLIAKEATRYDTALPLPDGGWEFISYKKDYKYRFDCVGGSIFVKKQGDCTSPVFEIIPSGGCFELAITGYRVVCGHSPRTDYQVARKEVDQSYANWLSGINVPGGGKMSELAAYITWSCVVGAEMNLTRPAMYSSKNFMANSWSWDNCFCALAVAESYPELALDQLLLFADHQDASGAYPDFINDRFSSFSCVKPPVFGWTCEKLQSINPFFNNREVIEKLYHTVERNTWFWMEYRKADGLFFYTHGNDSGWDNASVFGKGVPLEAPDLTAHLIRQADSLASMAEKLGDKKAVCEWHERAQQWTGMLLERLYDSNGFFARMQGEPLECRSSLLLSLPIIIGDKLPDPAVKKLLDSLKNRFLTAFGLATEELTSPHYRKDGYWLGPIWAPVMYLVTDALKKLGRFNLAKTYEQKFLSAIEKGGMAENFDPYTGCGNCDPAFAWTASVCLLYLRDFLDGNE